MGNKQKSIPDPNSYEVAQDKDLKVMEEHLARGYVRQEFIDKYDMIVPDKVLINIMNFLMKHELLRFIKWEDSWQNPNMIYSTGYELHVTNLNLGVTSFELKDVFEKFDGLLSVNIVLDPETGKSQGSAFVEYKKDTSRQEARRALHDTMLFGQKIKVFNWDSI